jgi:hypothetical protein
MKPEKFADFPSLASLLRYLKLCTAAALIDGSGRNAPGRDVAPMASW